MTDLLLDPTRCPDCGGPIYAETACPACGLTLRGPAAVQLWQVTSELVRLTGVRAALLDSLRPAARRTGPATAPAPGAASAAAPGAAARAAAAPAGSVATWPAAAGPATPGGAGAPGAPTWRPAPPRPRKEWTPQRVQNLLLATGVLLLMVTAIVFAAFTHGRVPLRAAVLAGVTAFTGYLADRVLRRGLTASAEAIGLLAVLLAVVDAYAARRANLAGLRSTDPATYAAVASAVLAAAAAGFARLVPVRSARYAALVAAQLPLAVTAAHVAWPGPARGALFVAQAVALVLLARRLGSLALPAKASALVNWSVGALVGWWFAYAPGSLVQVRGASALLAAAGAAALLWDGDRRISTGVATLGGVLAFVATGRYGLTHPQVPALIAATGLLAVVAAASAPRTWRLGPLAVGGGTVAVALLAVGEQVVEAVALPFSWAVTPWRVATDLPARAALADGHTWDGTVVTLGVVAVAAVALVMVAEALDRRRDALWPTVGVVAAAVLLVPLGFAWSYGAAVAFDLGAGLAGLVLAVALRRTVLALPATAVLAVVVAWSLGNEFATLLALLLVTLGYAVFAILDATARDAAAGIAAAGAAGFAAAVAASRGAPMDRIGFVLATASFSLVVAAVLLRRRTGAVVGAVAGVAYVVALGLAANGTGWLAWTLGGGALAAGLYALRDRRVAAVAAALGIACAGTTAAAYGAPPERAAFVVALACAAAVGAAYLLRDDVTEAVAAAGYAVALLLAAADPGWLSWVLAVGGLTALADALRPERRWAAWVGTALLTAWSWDRLWLADVRVPEAYAAPVALLALGIGHLRRRTDPTAGSWTAYGSGLSAAFGPTAFLVVTDPGVTRPVLLAVAGVAVMVAGLRERLQAPLTVGALALALDAVVQLAPVAVALPKWATLGAAGLLVIGVGVTYEDRRRDMARLRETFDRLA
jgi:hypothetical protein